LYLNLVIMGVRNKLFKILPPTFANCIFRLIERQHQGQYSENSVFLGANVFFSTKTGIQILTLYCCRKVIYYAVHSAHIMHAFVIKVIVMHADDVPPTRHAQ
jgi:hypothetical protein